MTKLDRLRGSDLHYQNPSLMPIHEDADIPSLPFPPELSQDAALYGFLGLLGQLSHLGSIAGTTLNSLDAELRAVKRRVDGASERLSRLAETVDKLEHKDEKLIAGEGMRSLLCKRAPAPYISLPILHTPPEYFLFTPSTRPLQVVSLCRDLSRKGGKTSERRNSSRLTDRSCQTESLSSDRDVSNSPSVSSLSEPSGTGQDCGGSTQSGTALLVFGRQYEGAQSTGLSSDGEPCENAIYDIIPARIVPIRTGTPGSTKARALPILPSKSAAQLPRTKGRTVRRNTVAVSAQDLPRRNRPTNGLDKSCRDQIVPSTSKDDTYENFPEFRFKTRREVVVTSVKNQFRSMRRKPLPRPRPSLEAPLMSPSANALPQKAAEECHYAVVNKVRSSTKTSTLSDSNSPSTSSIDSSRPFTKLSKDSCRCTGVAIPSDGNSKNPSKLPAQTKPAGNNIGSVLRRSVSLRMSSSSPKGKAKLKSSSSEDHEDPLYESVGGRVDGSCKLNRLRRPLKLTQIPEPAASSVITKLPSPNGGRCINLPISSTSQVLQVAAKLREMNESFHAGKLINAKLIRSLVGQENVVAGSRSEGRDGHRLVSGRVVRPDSVISNASSLDLMRTSERGEYHAGYRLEYPSECSDVPKPSSDKLSRRTPLALMQRGKSSKLWHCDSEESSYSCDQEGYFTTMHRDCGLMADLAPTKTITEDWDDTSSFLATPLGSLEGVSVSSAAIGSSCSSIHSHRWLEHGVIDADLLRTTTVSMEPEEDSVTAESKTSTPTPLGSAHIQFRPLPPIPDKPQRKSSSNSTNPTVLTSASAPALAINPVTSSPRLGNASSSSASCPTPPIAKVRPQQNGKIIHVGTNKIDEAHFDDWLIYKFRMEGKGSKHVEGPGEGVKKCVRFDD